MSLETGTSRKRARVDDANDALGSSLSSVQKDTAVWLPDGNIVVIAENVAFRVYKGTLALRSDIFRDLFSLPTADTESVEEMEGCPVVHVSDSHEDTRCLFLVLCCGKNYYYNRDELIATPFAVLASLIRMAHKYAIQDVLEDALSRLKKYYTTDLAAWQDPAARARYVTAKEEDALTVITLARLTNTPSLLPTAFFTCANIAALVVPPLSQHEEAKTVVSSLATADQVKLINGKAQLAEFCTVSVIALVNVVAGRVCLSKGRCAGARLEILRGHALGGHLSSGTFSDRNVLEPVHERLWGEGAAKLCADCAAVLSAMDRELRQLAWMNLPEVFHLTEVVLEKHWPSSVPADVD